MRPHFALGALSAFRAARNELVLGGRCLGPDAWLFEGALFGVGSTDNQRGRILGVYMLRGAF